MDKRASIFISVVMPRAVKERPRLVVLVVMCTVLGFVDDVCMISARVGVVPWRGRLIILWYVFRVSSVSSWYVYL